MNPLRPVALILAALILLLGLGCRSEPWDAGCKPGWQPGWLECTVDDPDVESCSPPDRDDYAPWDCGPPLCDVARVTLVVDENSGDLVDSEGLDTEAGQCMFEALVAGEAGTLELEMIVRTGSATTDPVPLALHMRGDGTAVADSAVFGPDGYCPAKVTWKSSVLELASPDPSCTTETDTWALADCAFQTSGLQLFEGVGPELFKLLGAPVESAAPSCG